MYKATGNTTQGALFSRAVERRTSESEQLHISFCKGNNVLTSKYSSNSKSRTLPTNENFFVIETFDNIILYALPHLS